MSKNVKMKLVFFGNKQVALFDWWSVGHIFTYFLVTKIFLMELSFDRAILILIGLGYLWEVVERILENYDHNNKKIFFKEKEGWLNRYVGDIISDMAGFLLAWFVI